MNLIAVTSNEQSAGLRVLPTLAIDLGFAEHRTSCGLSIHSTGVTFSEAVDAAARWINDDNSGQKKVLIVEAPLSGSFNEQGNPCARGAFETHHSETKKSSERRWQSGGGASMALAALHFIRLLTKKTSESLATVHLVEAFCSRYGPEKPSDTEVAERLIWLWQENLALVEPRGATKLSVLHILDSKIPNDPPAILRVPDGPVISTAA